MGPMQSAVEFLRIRCFCFHCVNDIPDMVYCKIKMFTDDTKLYSMK